MDLSSKQICFELNEQFKKEKNEDELSSTKQNNFKLRGTLEYSKNYSLIVITELIM